MLSPEKITVGFTNTEALVLFEFLYRFYNEDCYTFEDQAEQKVLCKVEGILESQLVEVVHPDYVRFLSEARKQVRDGE